MVIQRGWKHSNDNLHHSSDDSNGSSHTISSSNTNSSKGNNCLVSVSYPYGLEWLINFCLVDELDNSPNGRRVPGQAEPAIRPRFYRATHVLGVLDEVLGVAENQRPTGIQ